MRILLWGEALGRRAGGRVLGHQGQSCAQLVPVLASGSGSGLSPAGNSGSGAWSSSAGSSTPACQVLQLPTAQGHNPGSTSQGHRLVCAPLQHPQQPQRESCLDLGV